MTLWLNKQLIPLLYLDSSIQSSTFQIFNKLIHVLTVGSRVALRTSINFAPRIALRNSINKLQGATIIR